ncbi:MAG TPA: hypothetical protein VF184_09905 [Phycisphaeraceae bacterium]
MKRGIGLAVLMAALMTGCATTGGEEQNYRELERDLERFEPDPSTLMGATAAPATQPTELTQSTQLTLSTQPSSEVVLASTQPTRVTVVRTAEPSLRGMDRSRWPGVIVGPVEARITHGPTYFHVQQGIEEDSVLAPAEVEDRLTRALEGSQAEFWTANSLGQAVTEPVLFYANVVLLPVRAVLDPPWTSVAAQEQE